MARNPKMKQIQARIEQLRAQKAEIEARLSELEQLWSTLTGDEPEPQAVVRRKRAPRSNVKQAVLDLLKQVGAQGLNSAIVVDMARNQMELELDRGSVSSLLSRLKNEGTVAYDGKLYRLKTHAGVDAQSASIHPLRASSDKS